MKRKLSLVMLLMLGLFALACSSSDNDTGNKAVDRMADVQAYVSQWLASVAHPVITADQLKADIDQNKDYQIVSVRSAADYAKGHIKGAVNFGLKTMADDATLTKLDKTKHTVTYCYTGHTGQLSMVVLGLLGYDVTNLKFGMMGWTDDQDVLNYTGVFDCNPPNYPTETKANTSGPFEPPVIMATEDEDVKTIIQKRFQEYFKALTKPVITVEQVKAIIDDPNQAKNYQIVSVRKPDDYAKGHIKGAINIPWNAIAKPENLKKLDPSKKIITYCYSGHTGMVAATVLNLLGYDAIDMKYGMMGWTDDQSVLNYTGVFDCNPPNYETTK